MLWCLMRPGIHVMMPKQCAGCIDMARENPALSTASSVILPWRKKSMTDKSLSRACLVGYLKTLLFKSSSCSIIILIYFNLKNSSVCLACKTFHLHTIILKILHLCACLQTVWLTT